MIKPRTLLDLSSIDVEDTLENLGVDIAHRSGDELLCHCPHTENHANGDANPSFSFNMEKKVGMCYVCGPTTLLALTEYMLHINQDEAEDWLRQQAIPGLNRENLQEKVLANLASKPKQNLLPEYATSTLKSFRVIHPYLYERGISKDVAIEMQIGYDEEHDAIVIPHFFKGTLRGWQRRHLSDCSICDSPVPKYKSTKDLPKKITLYNYDNLADGEVIVVESPMSVLYLKSHGYPNCVATFGSWSPRQIDLLAGAKSLILWPDNDPSGTASITRVIEAAIRLVPIKIAPIVDQKRGDPADLSPEQLKEYIQNTYNPIEFKQNGLMTLGEIMFRKTGTPEKAEVVEDQIIEQHVSKTGKNLEELNDEEREDLWENIDANRNE